MSNEPSTNTTTDTSYTSSADVQVAEASTGLKIGSGFALALIVFWILGGIAALVMSIVCFGLSGSTSQKVVGLLIAFFLGPLYFIFYGVSKDYCRNLGANVMSAVKM